MSVVQSDTPFAHDKMLDNFDTYMYIIIPPIGMMTSFMLFVGHLLSKELRKQPGDFIMMIALAEFFLSLHWFTSALYSSFFINGGSGEWFCQVQSIIAMSAANFEVYYNLCFIVSIFVKVLYLNSKTIKSIYFHGLSIGGTILLVSWYVFKGKNGLNGYGTCSIQKIGLGTIATGSLLLLVSICFAIFVYSYINKVLPQHTNALASIKRNFVNFYSTYLKFLIVLWGLIFVTYINQSFGKDQNVYTSETMTDQMINPNWSGIFFNIGKLGNAVKVLTPIIMFMIRMRDPLIQKNLYIPFKNSFRRLTQQSNLMRSNSMNKEDFQELGEELASNTQDLMWINLLSTTIRKALYRSIMGCVAFYYPGSIKSSMRDDFGTRKHNSQEILILEVKGDDLMKALNVEDKEALLDCTFTIYAPQIFASIVQGFHKNISFDESLNIETNSSKIQKLSENTDEGKGGKSGEFFFLTHDKRLILKTTNEREANVFLDILPEYAAHFREHPTSQIGRIFGLFDINFKDAGKSIKFFVMEALDPIVPNSILRKYDLKGSKSDRKTLSGEIESISMKTKIKEVLKDNDFDEIDKAILLSSTAKENLINSFRIDVAFFRLHNIIDYSLIISVVDLSQLPEGYLKKELESRNHHIFRSAQDSSIGYFVGIIDYFQLYNFKKAMERLTKRVLKCNSRLDTSSQPPKFYGRRFFGRMQEYFVS